MLLTPWVSRGSNPRLPATSINWARRSGMSGDLLSTIPYPCQGPELVPVSRKVFSYVVKRIKIQITAIEVSCLETPSFWRYKENCINRNAPEKFRTGFPWPAELNQHLYQCNLSVLPNWELFLTKLTLFFEEVHKQLLQFGRTDALNLQTHRFGRGIISIQPRSQSFSSSLP